MMMPEKSDDATTLLIHGAWHGGWAWSEIEAVLQRRGQPVEVVDLPGSDGVVGVTLADQVGAVRHAMEADRSVRLVAHSFGAIPALQAAALRSSMVEELVLIDGWVVRPGQSFLSAMPPAMRTWCEQAARGSGVSKVVPPPPPSAFGVTDPTVQTWLKQRLTPQPWRTFADPSMFDSEAVAGIRGRAILCQPSGPAFDAMAASLGYPTMTIDAPHDAMLTHPDELVDLMTGTR